MLDTKFIREHVEEVKENIKNRHAKADVDAFVALDNQRRDILQKVEAMKNERNTVTKEIQPAQTQQRKCGRPDRSHEEARRRHRRSRQRSQES